MCLTCGISCLALILLAKNFFVLISTLLTLFTWLRNTIVATGLKVLFEGSSHPLLSATPMKVQTPFLSRSIRSLPLPKKPSLLIECGLQTILLSPPTLMVSHTVLTMRPVNGYGQKSGFTQWVAAYTTQHLPFLYSRFLMHWRRWIILGWTRSVRCLFLLGCDNHVPECRERRLLFKRSSLQFVICLCRLVPLPRFSYIHIA